MKKYEIVFIVSENYTEDRAANIAGDIKKLIESHGGKIEKEVFWGKRKLVYKIAKNNFGYYYVFIFDINTSETNKLNKELNLNEKILRYLIVDFIKDSPFFEEGIQDKSKKEAEGRSDEEEIKKPKRAVRKKEVELLEKVEPEKSEGIEKEITEENIEAQYIAPEQEAIGAEEKAQKIVKKRIDEKKPERKQQMTEEERKEQLEKKLAELLKDEEL